MSQLKQRHTIILGLVAAISGSMFIGLPALAQTANPTNPAVNSDRTSPANVNPPLYESSSNSNSLMQKRWNSNSNIRYNGNGLLQPNDDSLSPDSNNPGLNQSPENRLTPVNIN